MSNKKGYVVRFSRLNRALHVLMILSFITLSLTGMSLKFSYTGWAKVLSHFFGGFESAGFLHRFAAVVMIIVFITHSGLPSDWLLYILSSGSPLSLPSSCILRNSLRHFNDLGSQRIV